MSDDIENLIANFSDKFDNEFNISSTPVKVVSSLDEITIENNNPEIEKV